MARKHPRQQRPKVAAAAKPAGFAALAQYDAARHGRRMRGWQAPGSGPNRATAGMETIRNRTRDAARNDWSAAAGVRSWVTNLIGSGIVPRPKTTDQKLKNRLIDLWDEWAKYADADGVLDFYGMQTLAARSWITAGEVFIRIRPRLLEDGLPVPLQIQLLESDMVPMLDADSWPGLPAGNSIRCGIEINRIGRRVAYWCYRQHPGDQSALGTAAADLVRVPADEMRHMFEPIRPGQLRGVSDLAPVLAKLRGVMDFDDAVLERQRLANLFAMFITREVSNGPMPIEMMTTTQDDAPAGEPPMVAIEPGLVQELAPGEDVRFSEPPDAGANYSEFIREQHVGISAGQGLPYELLTGDLKDVSDRTLRIILIEFRRHCGQRQWQIIIPMMCQPIRDAWALAAALGGAILPSEIAEAKRVTWAPEAWAYIHPVQDVQAKRIEVEAGFRARSQVIAATGEDPDEVDQLRRQDAEREKNLRQSNGPQRGG
jgi:lambda family phage portal protein